MPPTQEWAALRTEEPESSGDQGSSSAASAGAWPRLTAAVTEDVPPDINLKKCPKPDDTCEICASFPSPRCARCSLPICPTCRARGRGCICNLLPTLPPHEGLQPSNRQVHPHVWMGHPQAPGAPEAHAQKQHHEEPSSAQDRVSEADALRAWARPRQPQPPTHLLVCSTIMFPVPVADRDTQVCPNYTPSTQSDVALVKRDSPAKAALQEFKAALVATPRVPALEAAEPSRPVLIKACPEVPPMAKAAQWRDAVVLSVLAGGQTLEVGASALAYPEWD